MQIFHVAEQPLTQKVTKTVVKCKFSVRSRNPLVISCSLDVQNCGEMQIFTFSSLRAGRTSETVVFVCRGRLLTPCAHFIHFCARRCSETYILTFWMARRCSETHVLILPDEPSRGIRWVDRAKLWRNANFELLEWPGRVNVCVLYLYDSSAHCICYHSLLNMVVPENLPRG